MLKFCHGKCPFCGAHPPEREKSAFQRPEGRAVLALALLFGAGVGFSLGLTGGGGSILAVPMLVYGLGVDPREAVGISLAAVGSTALTGTLQRLWKRQIELRSGLLFALAGMLGAPLGTYLGRLLPETLLLTLFAGLMLWVAVRMWRAGQRPETADVPLSTGSCQTEPGGRVQLDSRCALVLGLSGVITGILSGLFGVGGGFVVVPALVLTTRMPIHQAVATSLLVITLVSASGFASYWWAGSAISGPLTAIFVAGGITGLAAGSLIAGRLSQAGLQKFFAALIAAVALFVLGNTLD